MANPTVSDRVSPSGPLSGEAGPDGGLAPPGSQIAGDAYLCDQSLDSCWVAQMGPSNVDPAVYTATLYNASSPAPTGVVAALNPLVPEQPLTAGTWLVELELEASFVTSFPQSDENWGVLYCQLSLADLDGSGEITAEQDNIALPYAYIFTTDGGATQESQQLGSVKITFPVSITPEQAAAANGFPRRRFKLERRDSTAPSWPNVRFTSTSGVLEIHKETMVSIRRLR